MKKKNIKATLADRIRVDWIDILLNCLQTHRALIFNHKFQEATNKWILILFFKIFLNSSSQLHTKFL